MKWYEITAKAEAAEVWIYDEIGAWGIGAKQFISELNALKTPHIDLHVNSPGGDVFDGAAIFNALKRHPARVTSHIDGLAASIATIIALGGDEIRMAENALFMIHNPWGFAGGTAEQIRKTADVLDKVRSTMIGVYVSKSGQTEEQIVEWLDAETWMDSAEALSAGFVDEITAEQDLAACSKFLPAMHKLGFQHVPRAMSGQKEAPTKREIERALREAGCSSRVAQTILAGGYPDHPGEQGPPAEPPAVSPPRDSEPLEASAEFTPLSSRGGRIADRHMSLTH